MRRRRRWPQLVGRLTSPVLIGSFLCAFLEESITRLVKSLTTVGQPLSQLMTLEQQFNAASETPGSQRPCYASQLGKVYNLHQSYGLYVSSLPMPYIMLEVAMRNLTLQHSNISSLRNIDSQRCIRGFPAITTIIRL